MEILLYVIITLVLVYWAFKFGVDTGLKIAARLIDNALKHQPGLLPEIKIVNLIGDQSETDIIIRKDDGTFVCQSATIQQAAIDVLARLKINAATVIVGTTKYWFINNQVFDFDDASVVDQLKKAYNGSKTP
jgi:hypothetical protein